METNSIFNQKLLQVFILMNDEKEITYESFNDYENLNRSMFSRLMNEYQKMIILLKLKCTVTKEVIPNLEHSNYFSNYIYYQSFINEDYSFSLDDLSIEDEKKYIYVIFYLILKNEQYLSYKKIYSRLKYKITQSSFKRMINNFKNLVGFDIIKNELNSFIIDEN